MQPENEKVVAIVCHNQEGVLEKVHSVETKEGDDVLFLPREKGLVAVLGELRDDDLPAISRILEELEAGE